MGALYASYAYYRDAYFGTAATEASFPALARRASAELDRLTFGRIDTAAAETDAVKDACCAVVDVLYGALDENCIETRALDRERLDQYEVTYAAGSKGGLAQSISDAASLYLGRTGLLSRCVPYRRGCI